MTCKHSNIQTWKYEDGEPAMWSCAECRHKFVPFSQMLQEIKAEREACAKVCDEMEQKAEGTECCKWPTPADCAHAIRARGQA